MPADKRVEGKIEEYQDLKKEIGRSRGMRKVRVVPAVIGALGKVTKEFDR